MDVQTDDLITKADVADALMRSDEGDVIRDEALADDSDFEEEALETIRSVSTRIRNWLSRQLIVSAQTDYTSRIDWTKKDAYPRGAEDYPYQHFTMEYPVLSVTGKGGSTAKVQVSNNQKSVWATSNGITTLDYISGYKRPDQSLSDFGSPVTDHLSQGDIPTLPESIRNVAEDIVIFRLIQRISGLIGVSVSEVSYGEFENTKTKRDSDQTFEERKLRTLNAGHAAIA